MKKSRLLSRLKSKGLPKFSDAVDSFINQMRDKQKDYIILDNEEVRSDHFISDSSQWKENKTAYVQLLLLSLSSFGAHFSRHALAVIGIFMLQQEMLTTCGLGVLFSTSSLPSCILPLVIGYLVTSRERIFSIGCALLSVTCFAETLLTISLFRNSYGTAFVSQFLLGCGATSFTTIQRTMISFYLQEHRGFGMALCIAVSNFGKVLGKISIVPAKELTGSYCIGSAILTIACITSLVSWIALFKVIDKDFFPSTKSDHDFLEDLSPFISYQESDEIEKGKQQNQHYREAPKAKFFSLLKQFDFIFYALAFLHTLYTTLFHILLNFLPNYAHLVWYASERDAGMISALPAFMIIICTPIVGFLLDKQSLVLPLCLTSAVATVCGYYSLFLTNEVPKSLAVTMLALSHSIVSTFTLSEVSRTIHFSSIGIAFGIVEISDAFGSLVGNYLFGYLSLIDKSYFMASLGLVIASLCGGLLLGVFIIREYAHTTPCCRSLTEEYIPIRH